MLAGTYTFACRFDTEALLPCFKGSTLRGGLGHALRRITCALRQKSCASCLLKETCAYAFLFEAKENGPLRRPHPYALTPPDEERRAYAKGDPFSFSLLLFGKANDYLPHIVYAVQEMGRSGLGKPAVAPGRFRLETVRIGDTLLYDSGAHAPSLTLPDSLPMLAPETAPKSTIGSLTLTCETPLRLKHNNRLQTELPFHLVIRAALRRISALETAYGTGEPDLDYKGLAARATSVRSESGATSWVEFERYSSRQKTAMLIGGVKGTTVYQGENLGEFLPLLRYCEATRLGKQTSFGLGRIRVEAAA